MNQISSMEAVTKIGRIQPANCQVWLDFDGTVTRKDVIDELLQRYSIDDSWKTFEQQWQAGLIGSRQCLKEQFGVIRISQDELDNFLDGVELDTGFFSLLTLLNSLAVPVVILSDSVDAFIMRILQRHGIKDVPIRSNTMVRHSLGIELCCSYSDPKCECGAAHCKCSSIRAVGDPRRKSIYIGDGISDFCPAQKADLVFAKGALSQRLEKNSLKFIRYSNLNEVSQILRNAWSSREFTVREVSSIRSTGGKTADAEKTL
jgi:2-hydroxy-3-keto-5-methylthiopentenyl-1-phosphate phosphatase